MIALVGSSHIFLCKFAYLEAYNEKIEKFKLSEGVCPSQEKARSHIYKRLTPHFLKTKDIV